MSRTIEGTSELADARLHWAHDAGIDLQQPQARRLDRSIELGVDLCNDTITTIGSQRRAISDGAMWKQCR